MQKRVLAVHDISCIGRCSLTVALPILSAAGIETSVLPTAVLSTHTGNFEGFTFRDLTDDILPICRHWSELGIKFQSIFTGYLGSIHQMELVSKLFDDFSNENTLILVDPVMGDHGKLYQNLTPDFPQEFKKLCAKAHIITPNLTEASFMLGIPYIAEGYSKDYIEEILIKLSRLGPEKIVLTGVSFHEEQLGCATYDKATGDINFIFDKRIGGIYHGTGDVFSSALLAALMNRLSLSEAASAAVGFTAAAIRRTLRTGGETRYGVEFEAGLAEFGMKMKESSTEVYKSQIIK